MYLNVFLQPFTIISFYEKHGRHCWLGRAGDTFSDSPKKVKGSCKLYRVPFHIKSGGKGQTRLGWPPPHTHTHTNTHTLWIRQRCPWKGILVCETDKNILKGINWSNYYKVPQRHNLLWLTKLGSGRRRIVCEWVSEWVSGGLTPCRQLRPSSRRENSNYKTLL